MEGWLLSVSFPAKFEIWLMQCTAAMEGGGALQCCMLQPDRADTRNGDEETSSYFLNLFLSQRQEIFIWTRARLFNECRKFLFWEIFLGDTGNTRCFIVSREIFSCTSKIFSCQVRKGEETDWSDASTVATGQNSTVYSVQGLHPFSVYSFKVAAVNGVGLSRESDQSYYMITLREVSGDWWRAVTWPQCSPLLVPQID